MAKRDPRRIITPDAFTIAPDLLGVGLATPWRRLTAIAIDGLLIAVLSHVGGRMLLALASAVMLWRAGKRPSAERSSDRRLVRTALRFASVIAIFLFALATWKWFSKRAAGAGKNVAHVTGSPGSDRNGFTVETDGGKVSLSGLGLGLSDAHILPVIVKIGDAGDSAEASPAADSVAHWLRTKPDSSARKIASAIDEMFGSNDGGPALRASLKAWLPVTPADSMTTRIQQLRRANAALKNENNDLQQKYASEKKGFTFAKLLSTLSDILGFGFGWSALYFTTFTALMRGQTPGKKILGIKVIRLDGEPMTGWMCFERFGGYAASAATGLLGFAQILWDRNRQALHDKVAETVVVRIIDGQPVRPFDTMAFARRAPAA